MKRFLSIFFSLALLTQITFTPKSHAAYGALAYGTYGMIPASKVLGMLSISGGLITTGIHLKGSSYCNNSKNKLFCYIFVVGGIYLGTLLNENSESIEFTQINEEMGQEINITELQRLSFNQNLEEINLIHQSIVEQNKNYKIEKENLESLNKSIKNSWDNYLNEIQIDPNAKIALHQLQKFIVKNYENKK